MGKGGVSLSAHSSSTASGREMYHRAENSAWNFIIQKVGKLIRASRRELENTKDFWEERVLFFQTITFLNRKMVIIKISFF